MDIRSLIPFRSSATELAADPFSRMRREMDRLFEEFGRWPAVTGGLDGFLNPRVNLVETPEGLELAAELPGVAEKDIELELVEDVLSLKAEHRSERRESDRDRRWHLMERSEGTYLRRFQLPFRPAEDKVTARFENGVLHVHVPRAAEQDRPGRKIEVQKA